MQITTISIAKSNPKIKQIYSNKWNTYIHMWDYAIKKPPDNDWIVVGGL